jgi:signal transduction histidine kinase/ligand-binding sensor domain-containing protein/AraC-like DNA-binding protein
MTKFLKWVFLLLLLAGATAMSAQSTITTIRFEHINSMQGLSQNTVLCIFQDSYGFMWMGTRDGLNRYNGYDFDVFRRDGSVTGIGGNYIEAIAQDKNGDLWVATQNGLSRFDYDKSKFENFPLESLLAGLQEIHAILIDQANTLWVGTSSGLFLFDKELNKLISPVKKIKDSEYLREVSSHAVFSLFQDSHQNVWVGTSKNGVYKVDLKSKTSRQYFKELFDEKANAVRIEAIADGKDGAIWIGTYGRGAVCLRPDLLVQHFHTNSQEGFRITDNFIRTISSDKQGNIWIGTFNGLSIYDIDSEKMEHVYYNEYDRYGLSHGSVWSLYCDKKGSVWVGTYFGGLDFYDTDNQRFEHFHRIAENPGTLSHNVVGAFAEDQSGNLWIGTERGGLNYYDKRRKSFMPHSINQLRESTIKSLHVDKENNLWMGIFRNGLYRLNTSLGTITKFPHAVADSKLNEATINCLVERDDFLWAGTDKDGLIKFDKKTERFVRYPFFDSLASALEGVSVKGLLQQDNGDLWLATHGNGVFIFNEIHGILSHHAHRPQDTTSLASNEVSSLFMDAEKNVWVTTRGGGICLFDRSTNSFVTFNNTKGLINNTTFGMLGDNSGKLWVSSISGITRFDPLTKKFKNYSYRSGLPLQELNEGAFFKTKTGQLIFGGNNGFVRFTPEKLTDNVYIPPIVITDFQLSNRSVTPDDNSGLLKRNITATSTITLTYDQPVFTIEFAALNYHQSANNQYAYILEGFEGNWNNIENKRSATYTNLRDGTYIFKVKGSNSDGLWNDVPAQLTITVLPPPWRTWWAFVGYGIVIAIGLLIVRNNAVKTWEMKNNLRMQAIEKERLRKIHEKELQYFTDISHEFRTPLTLIINPLEQLMESDKPDSWMKKLIATMNYNSKRLLLLINQLLEIRQLEAGVVISNHSQTHIDDFVAPIVEAFKSMADKHAIRLDYQPSQNSTMVEADLDKLEKVFYNLIHNAFKFTPEGGTIRVNVQAKNASDKVHYVFSVSDNGKGIPQELQKKIFDRFYTFSKDGKGTGIGLSLVKSLVELMGGTIEVESKPGHGSTFIMHLALPIAHQQGKVKAEAPFIRQLPEEYMVVPEQDPLQSLTADKDTILVVEDDAELREYLVESLKNEYHVITSKNGEKALAKAKKEGPQLILSDIVMPEMDGVELCVKIKTDITLCHTPVILLTSKQSDIDRLKGLESGADDYIGKPFVLRELRARIHNILENRKKLREHYSNVPTLQPKEITLNSYDEKLLGKIMTVIEDNISDPTLSVEFVGKEVGLSRVHLFRKLKALTGTTPSDFIRDVRLKRAAQLIVQNKVRVSEIADHVGFQDANYFTKCFRKVYQCSPSEYAEMGKVGI